MISTHSTTYGHNLRSTFHHRGTQKKIDLAHLSADHLSKDDPPQLQKVRLMFTLPKLQPTFDGNPANWPDS
ncbi:hypothetical protein DdX_17380 [Ditylenchus destructor]|uniref:Uncharacterized protein n=1 Tax=Ditylenchus destructor TaxID=166010 RepID=A0AAD4QTG6_9BILA|nr:hypothetical protein DdX_17380 [Ditylenchus destructor]